MNCAGTQNNITGPGVESKRDWSTTATPLQPSAPLLNGDDSPRQSTQMKTLR